MLLKSAFYSLFRLKYAFKLVNFLRVMQKKTIMGVFSINVYKIDVAADHA